MLDGRGGESWVHRESDIMLEFADLGPKLQPPVVVVQKLGIA